MADQPHVPGAQPPFGWRASEIPAAKGLATKQSAGTARPVAPKRKTK